MVNKSEGQAYVKRSRKYLGTQIRTQPWKMAWRFIAILNCYFTQDLVENKKAIRGMNNGRMFRNKFVKSSCDQTLGWSATNDVKMGSSWLEIFTWYLVTTRKGVGVRRRRHWSAPLNFNYSYSLLRGLMRLRVGWALHSIANQKRCTYEAREHTKPMENCKFYGYLS